jgi:hypothetical protein
VLAVVRRRDGRDGLSDPVSRPMNGNLVVSPHPGESAAVRPCRGGICASPDWYRLASAAALR